MARIARVLVPVRYDPKISPVPTGIWQPDLDLDGRVRVDVKVAAIRQNDLHLAVPSGIGPSMAKSAPCRRAPRLPSPIA